MSIGLFTDKEHEPTQKEIAEVLGPVAPLWKELIHYGKKYGWPGLSKALKA